MRRSDRWLRAARRADRGDDMTTRVAWTLLVVSLLAAGCSTSSSWLARPWPSGEVARQPSGEASEGGSKTSRIAAAQSGGEPSADDPAEVLYRLGLRQADPTSGIRDYRAARATFTELLSRYPRSRRDAEARAWQATLTDLLVREDEARRANERLQQSAEESKRTKTNLERLKQTEIDLERRR
jgi:hypothetical protein